MLLSPSCSLVSREKLQILQINNSYAQAEIALFGAHLISFKPKHDQRERLWLSNAAKLDGLHAIRGGVPICWPWFGDHKLKNTDAEYQGLASHGYVRTQDWKIVQCSDHKSGTKIVLKPTTSLGAGFSGKAELSLTLDIGEQCSITLLTENTGDSNLTYTCALHTYFAIGNINDCLLEGLSGDYQDKTRGMQNFDTPSHYTFSEETDRVHLCQAKQVIINDANSTITVHSLGHDSVVVWNPWIDKSISMQDMSDNGYLTMVCVETAITQGQTVAARDSHTLEQIIE